MHPNLPDSPTAPVPDGSVLRLAVIHSRSQAIMEFQDEDISMRDFNQPPPPPEEVSVTSSYDAAVNGNPELLPGNALFSTDDASHPADSMDTSMPDHDENDELVAFPDAHAPVPHRLGIVEGSGAVADSEETPSQTDSDTTSNMVEIPKVEVLLTQPPDPVLPYSSSRTGLVYDPRMRFHTELGATEDDIHPEDPRRIYEIYNELVLAGLVENDMSSSTPDSDESSSSSASPHQRLLRINTRLATGVEICLVHSTAHYEWVEGLASKLNFPWLALMPALTVVDWDEHRLKMEGKSMDSVYLHPLTFYCSRLSAGGAIEATKAVIVGQVKNAIAVIRPPGHHAEHNVPGGFCFFNNVCIATRVCQQDFPNLCRKILILDWDVHHGNGIQNIFEEDPNVLYISLHVYQDGRFYPNSPKGNHLHVGVGEGEGKNVNIPWPQHFMGDGDYLHAFQQVVMPIAHEFNPDLVIIAAGFDAAEGDALGLCHVTPTGFAHMTHMLMSLANGKVVACLEGGYNLKSIAKSALSVTRTLMGEPPPRLYDIEPSLPGITTVKQVIAEHARYWKCLYPKESPEKRVERMGGERLHDILRERQALSFFSRYQMSPLFVLHEKLSRSFENQVLATYVPRPLSFWN
jgi:histone deacetylase 6